MSLLNGSKKSELYEHLFKSIKVGLGIDVAKEEEDPIKAFNEGRYPELERHLRCIMSSYLTMEDKDKAQFLIGYPDALRDYIWGIFEEASKKENYPAMEVEGKDKR